MSVANVNESKPISERKLAANRENAKKSTGPRSAEGKAKVSLNAVTHGLRSEMVVLPNEDPAEFEAMRLGFFNDWRPPTETRRALVDRLAAGAWRMRRCVKLERDRIAEAVMKALDDYEAAIQTRMAEGFRLLKVQPARALEFFKGEHAGVLILIEAWKAIARALFDPQGWNDPDKHHMRLLNLLGHRGDTDAVDVGDVAMISWHLFVWNRPDLGECSHPIDGPTEAANYAKGLRDFIVDVIADLEASLASFPDPDLVRQRVADLASFDPSREGLALQRYEAQLDRAFRSNVNQITKLTQTGIDLIEEASVSVEAPNKPTDAPVEAPNKATEAPPVETPNKPTKRPLIDMMGKPTADQAPIDWTNPLNGPSQPAPGPLDMQIH